MGSGPTFGFTKLCESDQAFTLLILAGFRHSICSAKLKAMRHLLWKRLHKHSQQKQSKLFERVSSKFPSMFLDHPHEFVAAAACLIPASNTTELDTGQGQIDERHTICMTSSSQHGKETHKKRVTSFGHSARLVHQRSQERAICSGSSLTTPGAQQCFGGPLQGQFLVVHMFQRETSRSQDI